ncbi:MAG: UbiD family decarboxylase [Bacteroidota bacterium]
MMAKDLRTFLKQLESAGVEEMIRVKKPVDPKYEATAVLRKLELEGRYPLTFFEKPLDLNGAPSPFPLVMNAFSTRKKLAMALGMPPEKYKMDLSLELHGRYQKRIAPVVVAANEAPVKEVVEEPADLYKYPIPIHHSRDGGPYILAGTMITRNRESGNYNLAMIRFHVKDRNIIAVHAEPHHHSGMIVKQYRDAGEKAPFAIIIGHHPSFFLGSQWEGPFDTNEYEMAGAAMQEPLRLVPSQTWGADFLVPADGEIIIEGEVDPSEVTQEGPIGEHTRYYKNIRGGKVYEHFDPLGRVITITRRKDAIFQSLFIGHPEHGLIGSVPKEAVIYEKVRATCPGVKGVYLTPAGVGRYICYISVKQRVAGEVRDAIMATFVCDWHIKYVIAVDEDVDVFNDAEILWAIATRTQPNKNFFVIPDAMGATLDPTVDSQKPYTAKMGIDATRPFGEPFPEVCEVPLDLLQKIRLEDYLG